MRRYDYIIAGAGAAGLSLIMHMIESGRFSDKTILIIDKSPKLQNDRTWCFWEQHPGLFEPIVYKKWRAMWFHGVDHVSKLHETIPYEYKMIRGIDFYRHSFNSMKKHKNIEVRFGTIANMHSDGTGTYLVLDGERIYAQFIFSSINERLAHSLDNDYFLWQHFKGWTIETTKRSFNPDEATLMDFRISQPGDTRFVYVMPFSEKRALVEFTVFSKNELAEEEYNDHLARYCESSLRLNKHEFKTTEEEFGMIPMTNFAFPAANHNIIYIGSAGGQTRASSGYTFTSIQKHSRQIVNELIKGNRPIVSTARKKFRFYDGILLKILIEKRLPGAVVFTQLFERNEIQKVFKFLDNDTSFLEDMRIFSTFPKGKFISAAITHLIGSNKKNLQNC